MKNNTKHFDPSACTVYPSNCQNHYIDEKLLEWQMKEACPTFFGNARKGEKRNVYRGHLIVRQADPAGSSRLPGRERTCVYAFDCRTQNLYSISVDAGDLSDAKRLIAEKLASNNAFEYRTEEITVMVPATIRVAVFTDGDKTMGVDVERWLHIGPKDQNQYDNPGDTFCTVANSMACNQALSQKTPA